MINLQKSSALTRRASATGVISMRSVVLSETSFRPCGAGVANQIPATSRTGYT